MDAGEMRERVTILDLTNVGSDYQWTDGPTVWAKVELTGKTNLFSKVGIGARDVTITMRHRPLSLHQAIRWRGRHLFLTEILPPVGGYMEIKAAVVDVREWRALGLRFPAVATEKYLGYAQERPMVHSSIAYVLVTPKAVQLEASDLVSNLDTDGVGGTYVVHAAHLLDRWKNEYEIARREEP